MSMAGKKHSEETRRKMRDSHLGKKQSPEWIAKRTSGLKGRKIMWVEKLRQSAVGKKATLETRQKMSEMRRGENGTFYGKRHSEESKNRISKSRIERKVAVGKNNPAWCGGTSFLPYCEKFNMRRKRAVRLFFDNICLCCGEHDYKRFLSVHHVDHDKDQGCNGKPFNLVPFCTKCHLKERTHQGEFKKYINKTLRDGFAWGIWSEEEYKIKVMYDE
jgi:hypothetical protein